MTDPERRPTPLPTPVQPVPIRVEPLSPAPAPSPIPMPVPQVIEQSYPLQDDNFSEPPLDQVPDQPEPPSAQAMRSRRTPIKFPFRQKQPPETGTPEAVQNRLAMLKKPQVPLLSALGLLTLALLFSQLRPHHAAKAPALNPLPGSSNALPNSTSPSSVATQPVKPPPSRPPGQVNGNAATPRNTDALTSNQADVQDLQAAMVAPDPTLSASFGQPGSQPASVNSISSPTSTGGPGPQVTTGAVPQSPSTRPTVTVRALPTPLQQVNTPAVSQVTPVNRPPEVTIIQQRLPQSYQPAKSQTPQAQTGTPGSITSASTTYAAPPPPLPQARSNPQVVVLSAPSASGLAAAPVSPAPKATTSNEPTSKPAAATQDTPAPTNSTSTDLAYLGYVSSEQGDMAILHLQGRDEIVTQGQVIPGTAVLVVQVTPTHVTINSDGHTLTLTIKESQ